MSVPKNNLADLLKRKANNPLNSAQSYTPSPRSNLGFQKPKFKPATSTPSGNSIRERGKFFKQNPIEGHLLAKVTNTLPLLSTLDFGPTKPPPIQTIVSQNSGKAELIEISDHSNPTTPNLLKRSSSDSNILQDPSPKACKRAKNTGILNPNKENLLAMEPRHGGAGGFSLASQLSKAVASPIPVLPNRDPPSFERMGAHSDLVDLPSQTLESFRNKHHELLTHVMQLLLDGMSSKGTVDTRILQNLMKELEERIEAIKRVEAQKLGEQQYARMSLPILSSNHSSGSEMVMNLPKNLSSRTSDPSLELPSQNVALAVSSITTSTLPMIIDATQILGSQSHARLLDDDDELWDSFDMHPHVLDAITRTPARPPHLDNLRSPYYDELRRLLKDIFGLTDFRTNQLEAMTATMAGRDVFVLMPTGGGKSLCYQLPAVCTAGQTSGVTIVVSPLTALMEDQVGALSLKGVDAFFWNADSLQHEVNAKLWGGEEKPSLLYITPEKLKASPACRNLLNKLYREKQLARFAIDEAHCISTWGQDFRNAYQGLGQLRQDYPDVPIIALTATANQRTREDIVNQLQLRNHALFTQSFNRPNLKYVIKNKKNILVDIVDFINREHQGHSGVIYCLARRSCEQVAEQLREKGVAAEFFHAGLSKEEKNRLLGSWKADKFRIIVATIAFGMGIDKADVRFVIHYDLPKSLSGYYQETGRAGRDGKPADCVLYYSFKDFKAICRMIENNKDREEPLTPEAIERQKDAAREVVKYCANISECRRVQILRHFGQDFHERECQRGCDNCLDDRQSVLEDVTVVVNSAVDIVQTASDLGDKITLPQLTSVLRGSNISDIRKRGFGDFAGFGACKSLSKELVELALDKLLLSDILISSMHKQKSGYLVDYIEVGPAAVTFRAKGEPLHIIWRPPPAKKTNKPIERNQNRYTKGKRCTRDLNSDPIEPFPDEGHLFDEVGSSVQLPPSSTSKESFPNSTLELYAKLDAFRCQVMNREGLVNKAAFMCEALLRSLCFACPRDYLEFNQIVGEVAHDSPATFEKYRSELLQICIQHHLGSITGAPQLSNSEMHQQFSYHVAS